ncbi:hypothetical protein G7Y89_g4845 [Cudoniella acicularis]|uniref:BTB domain-containing protein n=1 Tax=Cudoniella acicularis TaxID=354080 RepID=A0A8H4RNM5_9HELO|nr:hypothetical protein G7Y89_g4845 [Cudoniella acicularis]
MSSLASSSATTPVNPKDITAELFKSKKYGDLTIKCKGREFKVHRAIVCLQYKPLAATVGGEFKEATTGVIELKENEPEIVKRMLEFMYILDYWDDRKIFDPTVLNVRSILMNTRGPLIINTQVYIIADQYGVQELKYLANIKYQNVVPDLWDTPEFVESLGLMYEEIPEKDRLLKSVAVGEVQRNMKALLDRSDFVSLCREIGEIGVDVLRLTLASSTIAPSQPYPAACPICGANISYVSLLVKDPQSLFCHFLSSSPVERTCGEKVFKVHRAIVCPQSKPLAAFVDGEFLEATTGVINLKEAGDAPEKPEIFELLIKYFYTADYEYLPETPAKKARVSSASGSSSTATPELLIHTKVYIMSEKYDVAPLKLLATEKYIRALETEGLTSAFSASLKLMFDETSEKDRRLKDVALKHAGMNLKKLVDMREFFGVCVNNAEISAELLRAIAPDLPNNNQVSGYNTNWAVTVGKICSNCQTDLYVRPQSKAQRLQPRSKIYLNGAVEDPKHFYRCDACFRTFD